MSASGSASDGTEAYFKEFELIPEPDLGSSGKRTEQVKHSSKSCAAQGDARVGANGVALVPKAKAQQPPKTRYYALVRLADHDDLLGIHKATWAEFEAILPTGTYIGSGALVLGADNLEGAKVRWHQHFLSEPSLFNC